MKRYFIVLAYIVSVFNFISAQEWTLDSCISYALQNNKDLLTQSQDSYIAKWDKKIEQSKLLPQIKLSDGTDYYWKIPVQSYPGELVGQQSRTTVAIPIGTTWMANYGADATWTIGDASVWHTIKLESLKQQATKASISSFSKLLERNVAMAFYAVQIAKESKEMSDERYQGYVLSHQLIQELFNQGFVDKISLNQSQSILNNYDDALSKKRVDLENSLIDLKFWMGYDLDKPIEIERANEINYFPHIQFDEKKLPDYVEQQTKIAIARQQYKVSKYRLLPSFSIVGNYGQSGFADNLKILGRSSSWYPSGFVGLRISIPLFSLTDIHTSKRQKAVINQTLFEVTAHQENQRRTFIKENLKSEMAWKSFQTQKEQMRLSQENERLSHQKLEKGIIDMILLTQLQQESIDAQEKYSLAKIEYFKIYVELGYLQNNK